MCKKENKSVKLAKRLAGIIYKLEHDENPSIKELTDEFGVSSRTIHRDIRDRLVGYDIEFEKGRYRLINSYTKSNSSDIKNSVEKLILFLSLSQFEEADGSLQRISASVIDRLNLIVHKKEFFIKPKSYQELEFEEENIKVLKDAINHTKVIQFNVKANPTKAHPYKITNYEGIWYLFAKDMEEDKFKNFMISNIKNLQVLKERFSKFEDNVEQSDIDNMLDRLNGAWSIDSKKTIDAKIKVKPSIAEFFTLKKHLKSQEIVKKLDDGSIVLSFQITHREDLDNLVKAWLPDIEVIEPMWFREKILKDLKQYIKEMESQNTYTERERK